MFAFALGQFEFDALRGVHRVSAPHSTDSAPHPTEPPPYPYIYSNTVDMFVCIVYVLQRQCGVEITSLVMYTHCAFCHTIITLGAGPYSIITLGTGLRTLLSP